MQTDYPDFLIDAVPGARALAQEVEKLEAGARPLAVAVRAALDARAGKVRGMRHGPTEYDVRLMPVDGVSAAEVDALNAAVAKAERDQASHSRKVEAARKQFDDTMRAVSREQRRTIAEPVHRAAHAEALEAFAKLDDALRLRHDAAPYTASDAGFVVHRSFSLVGADEFGGLTAPVRALEALRAHIDGSEPRS